MMRNNAQRKVEAPRIALNIEHVPLRAAAELRQGSRHTDMRPMSSITGKSGRETRVLV